MLNRKIYLHKIKILESKIKDLGILIEHERRNSNEEELSVTQELLNKQDIYLKQIMEIKSLLQNNSVNPAIGEKYRLHDGENEREITLVSPEEADPSKNFISTHSPLGQAIQGKNKGEVVMVETPIGTSKYTILDRADLFALQ
jgi:transcription elongation factor GreA